MSSSTRLIHLYAFQSHLWNRAVARWVEQTLPASERMRARSPEGRLEFPTGAIPIPPQWGESFPLVGARLEGVVDAVQRELYEFVLARLEVSPAELAIEGIPGFALKSEERALVLRPRNLRVRPAEPDPLNAGMKLVRLSFDLPRGAYATLVVRRLFAGASERRAPEGRARHPRRE